MTSPPDATTPAKPGFVLALLVLVYTFNFIDRQIVGILAVPIKADLGLSDTQLGLMGGLAFALFYTTLGIPVALLADRHSRTWIITISLALWSLMTAICGLAQNFWHLFLARLGVGVGEAGGTAPAYSLIADYFPPHQRARALAIYSFGGPIGAASGIVFGGVIASMIDWRVAFFIVGLAGVALAPLFRLAVREPVRGRFDPPPPAGTGHATLKGVMTLLWRKPSFWALSLMASCFTMMGFALWFWLPSFFVRSFDLTLLEASLAFGGVLLVGGVAGIWLGGWLGDKYGQRNRASYGRLPAGFALISAPFLITGVLVDGLALAAGLLFVPIALGIAYIGPVAAAIQQLVPPHMRATASAVFLFINNLIGLGAGAVTLGALSDGLAGLFGADSLRYAIVAGSSIYLVAAVLGWASAKRLARDWHS
ncbi:MAG: MFS transporter [Sphingomonadales bacterium]